MGYSKREDRPICRVRDLALFWNGTYKNKQKERRMKKMHKMKSKKGYAILALVIAISFITVLTWNNLVQASYKTKENAGSTSFPNNDKYTYVEVKGPSGTSTLKLQVTHS